MPRERSLARTETDFERGEAEGFRLAHSARPLPPLHGGAYAVGLLYGSAPLLRGLSPRAGPHRSASTSVVAGMLPAVSTSSTRPTPRGNKR